jgi:hypothetical protein
MDAQDQIQGTEEHAARASSKDLEAVLTGTLRGLSPATACQLLKLLERLIVGPVEQQTLVPWLDQGNYR